VTETPKDTAEDTSDAPADAATDTESTDVAPETPRTPRRSRLKIFTFGVLPALALVLAIAAAYLLWRDSITDRDATARTDSVQAARDITVAMLTYQPDTIEAQLGAARERLSGDWKQKYGTTVDTQIVPEAKAQRISAAAAVAASASVSSEPEHAVVLLFVNQTVTVGDAAPTITPSSVRVTLDKVDDSWLISGFEPV
jgi:Mce-associated membrane protein